MRHDDIWRSLTLALAGGLAGILGACLAALL